MASLDDWLARLEQLHPNTIELGLERVRQVARALNLQPAFPLILVGGTNGKGSTCAYLEAVLGAAGYRTGLYSSPHLLRYNERVRVAGVNASDAELIAAFEAVEAARGDTSLTYFEFGTLGAMQQFMTAGVEVAILEVGLGGRLDAVNVWDADVAVITSIDLDHQAYLGDTREAIGYEKAGIFRAGRPAICAEPLPPASLLQHARALEADLLRIDQDFTALRTDQHWTWQGRHTIWRDLPLPRMAGAYQLRNAAAALAALEALHTRLPVSAAALHQGLRAASVAGRFQQIAASPTVVVDVAHNPEAARALAATLAGQPVAGRTLAVVGMLEDKDAAGVFQALKQSFDGWWVCTPDTSRACPAVQLAATLKMQIPDAAVVVESGPVAALAAARNAAREGDRIVAFGSFYTVAALLQHAATQH